MHTAKVLEYLKKHGQLLDSDIAAATSISLDDVRASLSELSASGDISSCTITSYLKGKKIGASYRITRAALDAFLAE